MLKFNQLYTFCSIGWISLCHQNIFVLQLVSHHKRSSKLISNNLHKESTKKFKDFQFLFILKNIFHKVCILCPTLLTWSALYVQFLSRQKTIIGFRSFVQTIVYARLKLQTDFSYFFLLISRLHASRASFFCMQNIFLCQNGQNRLLWLNKSWYCKMRSYLITLLVDW